LVPVAALAVLTLGNGWWLFDTPDSLRATFLERHGRAVAEVAGPEDPRFSVDRRDEQDAASAEWWAATEGLQRTFRRLDAEGPTRFDLMGGSSLLHVKLMELAEEWRGPPRFVLVPIGVDALDCDA